MTTSERLKEVLDSIDRCESEYEYCLNEVEIENKRLQDFLHSVEFEPKAEERSKLCTAFRQQRIHRRECKDRAGELEPIVRVIRSKDFQRVRNALTQALGDVRKFEKYERNRQYIPRVKEEL